MGRVRFPSKALTVCSREGKEFDCKNNHKCGKLAKFRLNNISKIHCGTLVILSYTSLELGLRNISLVQKIFKLSDPLLCNW